MKYWTEGLVMSFRNGIFGSFLCLSAFCSSSYATNGDQMFAYGTKSMGMGGVSIAMPFGAESGLANPALITYTKHSEFSASATFFFPKIKTRIGNGGRWYDSDSNFYLMPGIQYVTRFNESFYGGIGVWSVAGMGVDFSDASVGSGLMRMKDDLMLMHIAVPLAWKVRKVSIGIAPVLQAGMLDIDTLYGHFFDKEIDLRGGVVAGISYDVGNGWIVGAKYRSAVTMKYDSSQNDESLTLQQPAEYGVGVSYRYGSHTFSADYKKILWGEATGYASFGWQNQSVFAVGYQYDNGVFAVRIGYNRGKTPIDTSHTANWQDYFNLLGFPATSEEHYTIGGSYTVSKHLTVDAAIVYAPKQTKKGILFDGAILGNLPIVNRHTESSITLQADYTF